MNPTNSTVVKTVVLTVPLLAKPRITLQTEKLISLWEQLLQSNRVVQGLETSNDIKQYNDR